MSALFALGYATHRLPGFVSCFLCALRLVRNELALSAKTIAVVASSSPDTTRTPSGSGPTRSSNGPDEDHTVVFGLISNFSATVFVLIAVLLRELG
jgi:hypothetical protein